MDRLEAMSVLLAVIEAGSLSAASRRLDVPLATVSRKISDLETALKTKLLLRGGRQVVLTDAGKAYAEACRRILESVSDAERAASGEYQAPRGDLVVTTPLVLGRTHVLPVLVDFLAAYPDIRVRLHQGDRIVNLIDDHVDVAVRIGELPDSSLTATRVGQVRIVAAASPGYLDARGQPHTPEAIAGHDCIAYEVTSQGDEWRFRRGRLPVVVPIRPRLSVNAAESSVDAAVAGLGIVRAASYQLEGAIAQGRLIPLLEEFEPPPVPVSLVYTSQGRVPLKLRAFLDFAAPRLRSRLLTAFARGESRH